MINKSESFKISFLQEMRSFSNRHRGPPPRPKPVFIWELAITNHSRRNNKGSITSHFKRSNFKIIHKYCINSEDLRPGLKHSKPRQLPSFPVSRPKLPELPPRFKLLRHLHINLKKKDSQFIPRFLVSLKGMDSLVSLSWKCSDFYYQASNPNLKCIVSSIKYFKGLSNISCVSPPNTAAKNKSIQILSSSLKYPNYLSVLALNPGNYHDVHPRHISRLILALRHHKYLSNLNLSLELCNDYNKLFKALRYLTSLNALTLSLRYGIGINDRSVDILTESLKNMSCLSSLDLIFDTCCQISDVGVKTLSIGLKDLGSLSNFSLKLDCYQNVSYLGIRGVCISVCEYASLSVFKFEFFGVERIPEEGSGVENYVRNLVSVLERSRSLSKGAINGNEFDLRRKSVKMIPKKRRYYKCYL